MAVGTLGRYLRMAFVGRGRPYKPFLTSPVYPLEAGEVLGLTAALVAGRVGTGRTDANEQMVLGAGVTSGELIATIIYKSYNNYPPENLTVAANLTAGVVTPVITYKDYDNYSPESLTLAASMTAGELVVVITYIDYDNYEPEALTLSAGITAGGLQ